MKEIFETRKVDFTKKSLEYKERGKLISAIRLIFFLAAAVTVILLIKYELLIFAGLALVASFVIFGVLVNYHKKINNLFQFNEKLSEINADEIRRLDIDIDHLEPGIEYLSETHPFAYDLDIFGKHSLFQLINRAETPKGQELLAHDLQIHFDKSTISTRQEAIFEVKDDIEWRQRLQAFALKNKGFEKSTFSVLVEWLKSDPKIKTSKTKKLLLYLYWLTFLIALYFVFSGAINFIWIFAFNVLSLIVLSPIFKYMSDLTKALQKANDLLQAKKEMILHLEESSFRSAWLTDLKGIFFRQNIKASTQMSALSKIVDQLYNRGNMAYAILNSFLLLDIYILFKAESWKSRNQNYYEDWFEALAGFESINSFAGFAYANPGYSFPRLNDDFRIAGAEIGHPLIRPGELVRNDFEIKGRGAVAMITGSNMAGKSTFLRTIGINLVLAQAGAPVCAKSFSLYPCQVFSSMRTKDNLEESVSTFYAELLRIKNLLDHISKHRPTFYMLDEILKGTNSEDRHAGASALIRQLSQSNSFGLVSTHDLELKDLENEIDNFENYSFHSEVKGSEINFDYKLKKGPCETFNAVALMKKMGIYI